MIRNTLREERDAAFELLERAGKKLHCGLGEEIRAFLDKRRHNIKPRSANEQQKT